MSDALKAAVRKKVDADLDLMKILVERAIAKKKKNDDDVPSLLPPPAKKQKEESEEEEWVCAGHVWEDPPTECPKDSLLCQQKYKSNLLYNKKRYVLCKGCRRVIEKIRKASKKD